MARKKELKPKNPKLFYKMYRGLIKLFKKRVRFYHVGDELPEGTFILSNHESASGPLAWELFYGKKVRIMGNWEMNVGLKNVYRYQTQVYFHQKKHWNLFLARIVCLIASPLTLLFYRGLQLISIRDGFALRTTVNEACKALIEYKERTIIFPEDSSKGYFKELTAFKHGFLLICEQAFRQGHDLPVAVAYLKVKENTLLIDEPTKYSELLNKYKTRDNIAEVLKNRCNELGRLNHTAFNKA